MNLTPAVWVFRAALQAIEAGAIVGGYMAATGQHLLFKKQRNERWSRSHLMRPERKRIERNFRLAAICTIRVRSPVLSNGREDSHYEPLAEGRADCRSVRCRVNAWLSEG